MPRLSCGGLNGAMVRFCPICGSIFTLTPLLRIRKHMNVNKKPNIPPIRTAHGNREWKTWYPYPICEASGKRWDVYHEKVMEGR